MLLWKLLRLLFLPKSVRKTLGNNQSSLYQNSIAAFESDTILDHNAPPNGEWHMARKITKINTRPKNIVPSETGSAISAILKSADKRARAPQISPKRKELLHMMRMLYRKQQKIFDDLSPHRREALRLIAEHMLRVNEDEHKH